MSEKISISLNDHEQLLIDIRTLTDSATQLTTLLNDAISALPDLSDQGEFHNRVESGGITLNRYLSKAQTFQSLAELLFMHTLTTYNEMINTDRILAQDIANQALNDPGLDQETKDYIRDHPEEAVTDLETSITNGEMDFEGLSSGDMVIVTGREGLSR